MVCLLKRFCGNGSNGYHIILTGIMGIKWGLLYRITGNIWVGLGNHLFTKYAACRFAKGRIFSLHVYFKSPYFFNFKKSI